MKDVKALRQTLADVIKQGEAKNAELNGLLAIEEPTEEQVAKIEALEAEIDELVQKATVARAEVEAEERVIERGKAFRPLGKRITSSEPDPARTGGFRDLGDFALAVRGATPGAGNIPRVDDRLASLYQAQPSNFHQETGGSSGEGYLVPPAFREEIYELMFSEPDLLTMVDMEPTASNSVELLADESTPWGSGSVQAKWRNEGEQMTPSKSQLEGRQVKLHELFAFVLATEELLQDAPRLNNRLTRLAARAIRWKASDAIIYGTGVGQPLGYFNAGSLVTVAKESGQSADTIQTKNVSKMYSRLLGDGVSRAVWLANSTVIPEIMELQIGNQPIWTAPNSGFASAPGGFLLGRPIVLTEHAKELGDKGDLQFVDPMGYYATQKSGGIQFATSMHLYFDFGVNAFRWTFRFGGQPYLESAVQPNNGTATKSHFVTLAERA